MIFLVQVVLDDLEVGMKLRAIYAADGLFYNATVQSIDSDDLVTVMYTDYNHTGQV